MVKVMHYHSEIHRQMKARRWFEWRSVGTAGQFASLAEPKLMSGSMSWRHRALSFDRHWWAFIWEYRPPNRSDSLLLLALGQRILWILCFSAATSAILSVPIALRIGSSELPRDLVGQVSSGTINYWSAYLQMTCQFVLFILPSLQCMQTD